MFARRSLAGTWRMCERSADSFRTNLSTCCAEKKPQSVAFLEKIFIAAVDSVLPQKLIVESVKNECGRLVIGHKWYKLNKNVHLVGFGKAVLGMATATEKILRNHLRSGILCVPKKTLQTFGSNPEFLLPKNTVLEVYEGASGNFPDEEAESGAKAIVERIRSLCRDDILIVLVSGGGSALLPKPREGITLEDKLYTVKLLSSRGASINELNTVRKRLSDVKGGGLAVLSYPVTTVTLILSDVVGDPLEIIASGPTVPNHDKPSAAFDVLAKYNLLGEVSQNVVQVMKEDVRNPLVPQGMKGYSHVDNFIIGNNRIAIQQAKITAEGLGFRTIILSHEIESPVQVISEFYVNLAFEICKALHSNEIDVFVMNISNMLKLCQYNLPSSLTEDLISFMKLQGQSKGVCIIAGGETTNQVRGQGEGGRNQEMALVISLKLFKLKQVHPRYFSEFDVTFLGAGTDGIDGNSDAAGAIGCGDIIARAMDNYIDPGSYLANNDSHNFFKIADKGSHLITTGHTGTNVMDLHLLLIRRRSAVGDC